MHTKKVGLEKFRFIKLAKHDNDEIKNIVLESDYSEIHVGGGGGGGIITCKCQNFTTSAFLVRTIVNLRSCTCRKVTIQHMHHCNNGWVVLTK